MAYYIDSRVPETLPLWQASTAYTAGDIVRFSWGEQLPYVCRVAGTSGTSEPGYVSSLSGVYPTITDDGLSWEGCWGSSEFGWAAACDLSVLLTVSSTYPYGSPKNSFLPTRGRLDFLLADDVEEVICGNTYTKYEDLSGYSNSTVWPEMYTLISFRSVVPDGQFGWLPGRYLPFSHREENAKGPEVYYGLTYKVTGDKMSFSFPVSGLLATNTYKLSTPIFVDTKIQFDTAHPEGAVLEIGEPTLDWGVGATLPIRGVELTRCMILKSQIRYANRLNALILKADTVIEDTEFLKGPGCPIFPIGFDTTFMDGVNSGWEFVNVFNLTRPATRPNTQLEITLRGCDFSDLEDSDYLFQAPVSVPVVINAEGCIWPKNAAFWGDYAGFTLGHWVLNMVNCRRDGESSMAGTFAQETNKHRLEKVDGVYRKGGVRDERGREYSWHVNVGDYVEPFVDVTEIPRFEANALNPGHYTVRVHFLCSKEGLKTSDIDLSVLGPSMEDATEASAHSGLTNYATTRKLSPWGATEGVEFSTAEWEGVSSGYLAYYLEAQVYVSHPGKLSMTLAIGLPRSKWFVCPEPELLDVVSYIGD